jgi:hypothetical protein
MDMRVDAAWNDNLPRCVDYPPGTEGGEAAGRADRGNVLAADANIGWFGTLGKDGGTARDDDVQHLSLLR